MTARKPKFTNTAESITFEPSMGVTFPVQEEIFEAVQQSGRANGGQIRVADWNPGTALQFFDITLRNMTLTEKTSLFALFQDSSVNYMENTWKYFPDASSGTFFTVRLSSPIINVIETSEGRFTVSLQFREQI